MVASGQSLKYRPKSWYRRLTSFWIIHEFIIINKLAWPSVISAFGIQVIPFTSVVFSGHIGVGTYFDGASLALSFANVTGTSIVVGLSSGMDTLCSQAYGGKNYRLVGVYFQRAIMLCLLVCFPIWALWLNAESILILLHQDKDVAAVAGKYLRILCVAKPAVVIFTLSTKFLQTQNVVNPTIFLTIIGNVVSIGCQYLFVVYLRFGVEGSAISVSIAYWSLAILYIIYIRCSSLYHTSWPGWTCDAFTGWLHYCKYGIPGLIMVDLEWWTYEIGFLVVGGTSPYPKVDVGIYSIMFGIASQIFMVPLGFSVATIVRVGNLLGANNPALARKVACLCIGNIIFIGILFSVGLFILRSHLPFLFTTDPCIITGGIQAIFVLNIFQNFDGLQSVVAGVLKGCGRQGVASITNLIVFQLIGTPLAVIFSVVLKLASKGYWLGMIVAAFLQASIYLILLLFTNWKKVTEIAQENIHISRITKDEEISLLNSPLTLDKSISKVNKRYTFSYRNIIKCVIIFILILSFLVGLGFSIKHYPQQSNITPSSNSSLRINTTEPICPY
ncbi:hypothetical protein LOD99_1910 [Oopsacas minuta]|uniref:Multidrug and toxin extrusion protein n=1 Tax=Oopsacas minuta TaxID=111878 RepID=A0AAV7K3E3_9METZ|nr:hypothetical protein LOD99_1910 [Oopsacas minuta]